VIVGIGVDLVKIERVRSGLRRFGDRMPRRILNEHEYSRFRESRRPAEFLAQRFAAKEAAAKALGTGFSAGVFLRDICITNDARGKPELRFSGDAHIVAAQRGVDRGHVSLSDEGDYAIAFVTLEQLDAPPIL
jgi:holo-[acyl-carrier protein] synthase